MKEGQFMNHEKTILIVEDDKDIRESLQQILEYEHYRVMTVQNGREALTSLAQAVPPCLIVLDLFMPEMNGPQFLSELKSKSTDNRVNIPVIVLSASPADGEVASSVKPLVSEFVKKPVDLDEFILCIERHCCKLHAA